MYGYKPPAARRLAQLPQQLADGGLVARMKSADAGPAVFGSRGLSQLRDMIPKMQAMGYSQQAAATPAADPRAAQLQAMIPQMEAMGYKQNPQYFANGGRVRPRGFVAGSGTGTSDSIPARLSNGEYVLPADTVKAVGVEALDSLRAATHTPVKHEQAKAAHGFFAGGTPGGLDEEKLKNSFGDAAASAANPGVTQVGAAPAPAPQAISQIPTGGVASPASPAPAAPVPTAASTQSAGQPLDAQAASDRAKLGAAWDTVKDVNDSAGRAIADVAMLAPRAVAGAYDSAVVRPMRAAGFNAGYLSPILVPNGVDPSSMTPYTDQKRMKEQAGAAAPSAPAATSSVAATASTAGAGDGRGSINPPVVNPDAPAPTSSQPGATQITPGVFRSGNSYSDSAQGAIDGAASRGLPTAQNLAAAEALAQRSQQESMARVMAQPAVGFQPAGVTAPTVRHSGNDWQSRNDLRNAMVSATSIMNDGGKWDKHGKGVVSPERAYAAQLAGADAQLRGAQPGVDVAAMRENAGIQREGMQQTGANQRAGMGFQTAQQRLAMEQETQGFANRAAQQSEQLRNTLLDPNATPEQRKQAQETLLALSGKERGPRWKTSVVPGGVDALGNKLPGYGLLTDEASGESKIIQPGQGGAAQTISSQAQFDALPKGATYIGEDGRTYRKPA